MDQRHHTRNLLIVIGVALALRVLVFVILFVFQHRLLDEVGGGDASGYMALAASVYTFGTLQSPLFMARPLLFPVLAAMVYHVVGLAPFAVVWFNLALNVLTCGVIYQIARTIGDSRTGIPDQTPRLALIAGLVAALYPSMLMASVSFMTEALFAFFFAVALLLMVRFIIVSSWRNMALSAAMLALATLTRAVTLILPLPLALLIVRRGQGWKKQLIVYLLISAVPIVVLTYRNWVYNGIASPSTESAWMLLFMRATSSERRVSGEEPGVIYARYIREIEQRLGHPEPQNITPTSIWGYFQPTPAMHAIITQMAIEKNARYPQWYVLNGLYGLVLILFKSDFTLLPAAILYPLHAIFVALALIGWWAFWRERRDRHWAILLSLPIIVTIGLTLALETALVDTRHGLAAALPMFVLAARGITEMIAWYTTRRADGRFWQPRSQSLN